MRCSEKIINPQDQADAAEPCLHGEGGALRQQKRVITGNISACLRGPVNWGAEKKQGSWTARYGLEFSCHLSCVPKKGNRKKGTRRKFLTPCSVVLGTFRKQPAFATCAHKRWPQARQPSGFRHPKCFTLGLGRLPKFSHGGLKENHGSDRYPNTTAFPKPPASHEQVRAQACDA